MSWVNTDTWDNAAAWGEHVFASALTDTFATQDTSKWTFGSNAAISGGALVLTPGAVFDGITSVNWYSGRDPGAYIQLVTPPPAGNGTIEARFILEQHGDANQSVIFIYHNGSLIMRLVQDGVNYDATLTYNASTMKYLRMRHFGSSWYWDTSPDAVTWTQRRGFLAWPPYPGTVRIKVFAGYTGTEPSPGTVTFDNLNTTPPVFTGTVAQTGPAPQQSAVASRTVPAFTATVTQPGPSPQQAATASRTVPAFTATAAQTGPSPYQTATATRTNPAVFTATVTEVGPSPVETGSSDTTEPYTGPTGTVTEVGPSPQQYVVAAVPEHAFTAAITQTGPSPSQQAVASRTIPAFTGTVGQVGPSPRQSTYVYTTQTPIEGFSGEVTELAIRTVSEFNTFRVQIEQEMAAIRELINSYHR